MTKIKINMNAVRNDIVECAQSVITRAKALCREKVEQACNYSDPSVMVAAYHETQSGKEGLLDNMFEDAKGKTAVQRVTKDYNAWVNKVAAVESLFQDFRADVLKSKNADDINKRFADFQSAISKL